MAVGRILMVDGRMDQNVVLHVYVGGVGLMRVLNYLRPSLGVNKYGMHASGYLPSRRS